MTKLAHEIIRCVCGHTCCEHSLDFEPEFMHDAGPFLFLGLKEVVTCDICECKKFLEPREAN